MVTQRGDGRERSLWSILCIEGTMILRPGPSDRIYTTHDAVQILESSRKVNGCVYAGGSLAGDAEQSHSSWRA